MITAILLLLLLCCVVTVGRGISDFDFNFGFGVGGWKRGCGVGGLGASACCLGSSGFRAAGAYPKP